MQTIKESSRKSFNEIVDNNSQVLSSVLEEITIDQLYSKFINVCKGVDKFRQAQGILLQEGTEQGVNDRAEPVMY